MIIETKYNYMKRAIKFRGKRLINGDWVYGDLHIRAPFAHIHSDLGTKHHIDIDTVGQFTGLLDKNGKEIYFDDIVRNKFGDIGCVIWFSDWSLRVDWGGGDIHFIEPEWGLEVIGNIHDNPELLNK